MNVDRQYKPQLCVSDDMGRPSIHYVYLDVEKKQLAASDGKTAVIVPCEPHEGDTSGTIPVSAFETAQTASKKLPLTIQANGNIKAIGKCGVAEFDRPYSGMNLFKALKRVWPTDKPAFKVGIDTTLLANLAKAMGSPVVSLSFSNDENGKPNNLTCIRVTPNANGNESKGIIMPCRIG